MALEGEIKEFGLADVIQLIASSQKTGVIFLDRPGEQAAISFRDGEITGAIHTKGGKQDQLHEFLFRSKRLDQETVRKVLQIQNDTGLSVDEILIKEYLMTREEVETAIATKIQEVIDDVFTWRDAHYRFDSEAKLFPHSRTRVSISTEPLLMEAMRRKDEWPMITRTINSDELVLEKVDLILPDDVEPDVRKIYNIFQERHKVGELVEMSGLGRFRTYAAAHVLVQLGGLKKAEAPKPVIQKERAQARSGQDRMMGYLVSGAVSAVILVAALGWAIWQWPRKPGPSLMEGYRKRLVQQELCQRLEIYRYRHGTYPDSLTRIARPEEAAGFSYQLGPDSAGYRLEIADR